MYSSRGPQCRTRLLCHTVMAPETSLMTFCYLSVSSNLVLFSDMQKYILVVLVGMLRLDIRCGLGLGQVKHLYMYHCDCV